MSLLDRRRIRLLMLTAVMLLWVVHAYGGGVFSSMYFGESIVAQSSHAQGLGGAGLGSFDGVPDAINPASLARSSLACFGLIYRPQFSWADDGYSSQRLVSGQLSSGIFSLPLGKGLYIGLAAEQLHSSRYKSFQNDSTEAGIVFEKRFSKSGGIYGGGLSFAFRPVSYATIGVGYRWLFGGINETTEVDFESALYNDSEDQLVEKHDGRYFSLGASIRTNHLGIGLYYRPKIDGTGRFDLTTTHQLEKSESYDFSLAERFGIGLSTGPWSGLTIVADIWHENWADASYGSDDAHFFDCTPVSIGFEYRHVTEEGRRYPPLRLGYRWRPGYYTVRLEDGSFSTKPPSDQAVSIGTSFTAAKGRGALDLALLVGQRGGRLLHDVTEQYVELSLGFTGFEKWSTRRFPGS